MKVIDLQPEQESRSTALLDRLPGGGRRAGTGDQAAQERVAEALGKSLSNQYVLLKNVDLEGLETPAPFVLVGPAGIRVLVASSLRGVYRVQGETWEKLDDRRSKYQPALPNLIQIGLSLGSTVGTYIKSRKPSLPVAEPVLVFTEPGLHLEAIRPAVRVVMVDGLERFIAGLLQSPILLNQEEVAKVVDLLSQVKPASESPAGQGDEEQFSPAGQREGLKPGTTDRLRSASEKAILPRLEKISFTSRQWIILGVITFVAILVLVAFLVLVLSTS